MNPIAEYFPTEDSCLEYVWKLKYGEVVGYHRVIGRKAYVHSSGKQIYPLVGTIFEKTTTSLRSWFLAIYFFSQSENGISAKELQRKLGVTYKCAWRIAKSIRFVIISS